MFRDTDAHAEGIGKTLTVVGQVLTDRICQAGDIFRVVCFCDNDEFITAVACDVRTRNEGTAGGFDAGGRAHESPVAFHMPVVVVDTLEIVHVHHQQVDIFIMVSQLLRHELEQVLPVVDLCQTVDGDLPNHQAHEEQQKRQHDDSAQRRQQQAGKRQRPSCEQAQREEGGHPEIEPGHGARFPAGLHQKRDGRDGGADEQVQQFPVVPRPAYIFCCDIDIEQLMCFQVDERQDDRGQNRDRQKDRSDAVTVHDGMAVPDKRRCIDSPCEDAHDQREVLQCLAYVGQ